MNKKLFIIFSASALAVGILFFLFYSNRISVNFRFGRDQASNNALVRSEKKSVTMWYWINGQFKNEQREILWTPSVLLNVTHVIAGWLALLDQEEAVAQPCTIQDVSLSEGNQELIISLDRVPFGHDDATYDKLMLIESLLKTLRGCQLSIQRVRFWFIINRSMICILIFQGHGRFKVLLKIPQQDLPMMPALNA